MTVFLDGILADPLWFVGLVLATLAAIAFLTFLRGFLSGTPHLFTLSGHDEHIAHHRVRITWGFFSLVFLFALWRLLQWVVGLFTA